LDLQNVSELGEPVGRKPRIIFKAEGHSRFPNGMVRIDLMAEDFDLWLEKIRGITVAIAGIRNEDYPEKEETRP
jgi:hypothetical protein